LPTWALPLDRVHVTRRRPGSGVRRRPDRPAAHARV